MSSPTPKRIWKSLRRRKRRELTNGSGLPILPGRRYALLREHGKQLLSECTAINRQILVNLYFLSREPTYKSLCTGNSLSKNPGRECIRASRSHASKTLAFPRTRFRPYFRYSHFEDRNVPLWVPSCLPMLAIIPIRPSADSISLGEKLKENLPGIPSVSLSRFG